MQSISTSSAVKTNSMPFGVSDSEESLNLFVFLDHSKSGVHICLFVYLFHTCFIHLGHFVPSIRKVWLCSQLQQIEICAEGFWKWWHCSASLPPSAASSYGLPGEDEVAVAVEPFSVREQAEN